MRPLAISDVMTVPFDREHHVARRPGRLRVERERVRGDDQRPALADADIDTAVRPFASRSCRPVPRGGANATPRWSISAWVSGPLAMICWLSAATSDASR